MVDQWLAPQLRSGPERRRRPTPTSSTGPTRGGSGRSSDRSASWPARHREQPRGRGRDLVGEEEVRLVEAGADAGAGRAERLVDDREHPLVPPHVPAPRAPCAADPSGSSRSSFSPLARRCAKSACSSGEPSSPWTVTSWKNSASSDSSSAALEQRHVERVLEVGGAVRGDHERGAVVGGDPGQLGDVLLGRDEVLDDVRRAHPVDRASTGHRCAPPSIAAKRRPCGPHSRRGVDRGLRVVVDADDQAADPGQAGPSASPTPHPTSSTVPAPSRSRISRYPASWNARRESGVAPTIGRSPVSRAIGGETRGATFPSARAPCLPNSMHPVMTTAETTRSRSPSWATSPPRRALHRVSMLAWRDLDDPEAGGSELHASNIAALWAEAGIEVTMRTSYAAGHPQVSWRDGYRVIRKAGRYLVFPRAAFSEMMGWHGGRDGLVEIWNGMPFFSPLWSRTRARHLAAPRARRDVADDAAAPARRVRQLRGVEAGAADLPPHARSSRCRSRASASSCTTSSSRPTASAWCRPGSTRSTRPAVRSRPRPLVVAVGPARAGEAVRRADRRAASRSKPAIPVSKR